MQKLVCVALLFLVSAAVAVNPRMHAAAQLQDPETLTYSIEKIDEADMTRGNADHLWEEFQKQFPVSDGSVATDMPASTQIDWSAVVNIGMKVWDVIQKNQPVLNVSKSSASAVPKGVTSWTQMAGWRDPISQAYRITYKNGFNANVVDFTFRLVFIYGGSYEGKGQYLTGISVIPSNVDVLWGYTFEAKVSIPDTVNTGSLDAPIAGATVELEWNVSTILKKSLNHSNWWVRGDGVVKQL